MSRTLLKELREEKGLTQMELAKILEVANKSISNWETGSREMDIKTINKICDFFNVSADYFLKRKDY